jgi:hypothetical protein
MGRTPDAEGRTRAKHRKRKAQERPATADAARAAGEDRSRSSARKERRGAGTDAARTLGRTPRKEARVRGRSTPKSRKPAAAGRGR